MEYYDLVIIGGGPAGLAAAIKASEQGIERIVILEREHQLGGILNQCIHNGFGLHWFQEELTGPDYAIRFVQQVCKRDILCYTQTMVIHITNQKVVTAINRKKGLIQIQGKAIVLAMGCRERALGALPIPGFRPAGIFTAGLAQRLVNVDGYLPGQEVVVLGSGDIGLIMARRMTLEGAEVKMVCERLPYSGGLKRNIVQCLQDFDIPLLLQHTITEIRGKERVKGVLVARVDDQGLAIPGSEKEVSCDTLLLSVGLIPENELSRGIGITMDSRTGGPLVNQHLETNIPGFFACGNVLHVHDLVDYVSEEACLAGQEAAAYIRWHNGRDTLFKIGRNERDKPISTVPVMSGQGIRYVMPQYIQSTNGEGNVTFRFRVDKPYRKACILMMADTLPVFSQKRRILLPGEMESFHVNVKKLFAEGIPATIQISIREEQDGD